MPIQFLSQLIAPKIGADGSQSINGSNFRTSYHATQPKTDAYGQYDRALEHGFGGEQFRNGKKVGGLLNFEA